MENAALICKARRLLKSLLLAGLAGLAPVAANAAWTYAAPVGGNVLDFALAPSNPSTMIATTAFANEGIWTSADSGANWTQQVMNTSYHGAAVKPDDAMIMLAGVLGGVIDRSIDGGMTWAATIASASHFEWRLEFAPSAVDTAYAVGYSSPFDSGSFQKSTNAGVSWASAAIGGDANPPLFSLAVDPSDADNVYLGAQPGPAGSSDDGLYQSTDGGASWNHLDRLSLTRVDAIAVDPVDSDYLYAGTTGSGKVWRSSDGGLSWQKSHDPANSGVANFTSVQGLVINPAERRVIYALGGSGSNLVIVSTDCGESWTNVDATGLVGGLPNKGVIDTTNNFLFVRTQNGSIYREALVTAGSGVCRPLPGFPTTGSSSSSGSSVAPVLLGLLLLIGILRCKRRA